MIVLSKLSKQLIIYFSEALSNEFVISSQIKIFLLKYRALAIPIRWICPPDNFVPLSPTSVSNPLGNLRITLFKFINLITFLILL